MDNFNPSQMPPQMPPVTPSGKKSIGPLIAVIIILALIIVGGLYFLKMRSEQQPILPPQEQTIGPVEQKDAITESLQQQSRSDDLNSIENDLKATEMDNLDQGASVISSQLR